MTDYSRESRPSLLIN